MKPLFFIVFQPDNFKTKKWCWNNIFFIPWQSFRNSVEWFYFFF